MRPVPQKLFHVEFREIVVTPEKVTLWEIVGNQMHEIASLAPKIIPQKFLRISIFGRGRPKPHARKPELDSATILQS